MKRRVFDLVLLAATVVGGVLAWQADREQSRLRGEFERLARKTGDLPIADPSRIHVRVLDTGEPLHFAWRVYIPPNYKQVLKGSSGGHSTTWSQDARQAIARVRFREDEQGELQVYTRFPGGSSRSGLGDRSLAELLRGRWDEVLVEQLGAADVVAVAPDRPAVLLRLTLPGNLQDEARETLSPHLRERHVPVLFELELLPPTSKP
jgi:hypothetical protein